MWVAISNNFFCCADEDLSGDSGTVGNVRRDDWKFVNGIVW